MNPGEIFLEARADGVTLTLSSSGGIKMNGDSLAVNRWVDPIKEHKDALVGILKGEPCWRWRISFADREPLIVMFSPEATRAEALTWPGAIDAEPEDYLPDETLEERAVVVESGL